VSHTGSCWSTGSILGADTRFRSRWGSSTSSPSKVCGCEPRRRTSETSCPYGSGAHPYLTIGTQTVDSLILHSPAGSVLTTDARGLPTGTLGVEGTDYDFRNGRRLGTTALDHAFTNFERGRDGLARFKLSNGGSGASVTLWMDRSFPYAMLFTGDRLPHVNRRSLAVEPMTCPPNAFRSGEGLTRLEPGQLSTSVWGITPWAQPADGAWPSR
jgi:aldose 1-epimerase